MKLAYADEMREMDRTTIEEWGLPGAVLMENAGRAATAACEELLEELPPGPVIVVAGAGNNGGDGFVVARWLHDAGYSVEVCLLKKIEELSGDAAMNASFAVRMGVPIREDADRDTLQECLSRATLIVDAVLGTGITGEVHGGPLDAIEAMNAAQAPIVALDIPSGIHTDTGAILGDAVRALVTVTFGLGKVGLFQHPGRERAGQIIIAPIGISGELSDDLRTNLTTGQDASAMLPGLSPDMHKGDAGRLLIVAGSVGMTGAAALTALAATRSGAGLVYITCPESINDTLEIKCTEALTRPMPETADRSLALEAAEPILEFAAKLDAVVLGPGLSPNEESAKLARRLAAEVDLPMIIDADGLNAFADRAEELADRQAPTVLTPHPGEMSRLTGESVGELQSNRPDAARQLAERSGCVVLLKGAMTVIAAPDGEVWINPTGTPGLATGGVGDVLSGMIGTFLAAGSPGLDAAVAAAYYHGAAAEVAASDDPRGLVAPDLLETLPTVFPG